MNIVVGDFDGATPAMGPGLRACLWVAGCPFRCPGCMTPDLLERGGGTERSLEDVLAMVDEAIAQGEANGAPIEGLSFSGGEPFAQAEALSLVAAHARSRGLSTLSWSGYTHRVLTGPRAPAGSADFLARLDVLIDGLFVQAKSANDPFRGSSNQRIHRLTDRYSAQDFDAPVLDVRLTEDGVRTYGVADLEPLKVALKLLGVR